MAVKFKPENYHVVTPLISVKGAGRLIEFMKSAFGAVEVYRFSATDGSVMHAEVKIGDSVLMLGEAMEGSAPMAGAFYSTSRTPMPPTRLHCAPAASRWKDRPTGSGATEWAPSGTLLETGG